MIFFRPLGFYGLKIVAAVFAAGFLFMVTFFAISVHFRIGWPWWVGILLPAVGIFLPVLTVCTMSATRCALAFQFSELVIYYYVPTKRGPKMKKSIEIKNIISCEIYASRVVLELRLGKKMMMPRFFISPLKEKFSLECAANGRPFLAPLDSAKGKIARNLRSQIKKA